MLSAYVPMLSVLSQASMTKCHGAASNLTNKELELYTIVADFHALQVGAGGIVQFVEDLRVIRYCWQ